MNTNKEKYLDTTLVEVGKEILKNQLLIYEEADDKEMVYAIKLMINDDDSCYDIARRLILKSSENDNIVFETLSLVLDSFAAKIMEAPEELLYLKNIQKACEIADELSKTQDSNTRYQEFENILKFCKENDIPLNSVPLPNICYVPREKPYRLTIGDFYDVDLVEIIR